MVAYLSGLVSWRLRRQHLSCRSLTTCQACVSRFRFCHFRSCNRRTRHGGCAPGYGGGCHKPNILVTANRVLACVRKLFAWAASRDIIATSPCAGVKPPTPETARDRVLGDGELRDIWSACDRVGWPFGPMVKLLMLTAQRRDEVAEMRWTEIDFENLTWMLARERVKNDQMHAVPLSDTVLKILEALPHIKGDADFVFTTTGCNPIAGFSRAKERLDDAIAESRGAALEHGTFHDLRRTAASGMARLGINLPVIEKVLNHSSGSFAGIVGVYQRYNFSDEKKVALDTWGKFVEELVGGEPSSNVIELARSRQ
jgi:integrase